MSRGKDALASWLVLREHGFNVVPFHLSVIPGLEFVLESLAEIERKFDAKVIDLPHPALFRMLDACVFQPPERIAIINEHNPKMPTYDQIYADVRQLSSSPDTSMVASGVRANDSTVRRLSFQQHGHVRAKKQTFFPCWNFNKADVMALIRRHGVLLPADYTMFGRSFDGIDRRFLEPLKQYRPRDYALVLEWFPLSELELYRHGISG